MKSPRYIINTVTIIFSILIVVAALIFFFLAVLNSFEMRTDNSKAVVTNQETDKPFSAPARHKAEFYKTIDARGVQYSVAPLVTNMTTDTVHGGHVFSIEYYNSTSEAITPTPEISKRLDVGCIAQRDSKGYRTVKDNPAMFTATIFDHTKRKPNSGQTITPFEPWKRVAVEIEVHPTCVYLGTYDLQYYWKIK